MSLPLSQRRSRLSALVRAVEGGVAEEGAPWISRGGPQCLFGAVIAINVALVIVEEVAPDAWPASLVVVLRAACGCGFLLELWLQSCWRGPRYVLRPVGMAHALATVTLPISLAWAAQRRVFSAPQMLRCCQFIELLKLSPSWARVVRRFQGVPWRASAEALLLVAIFVYVVSLCSLVGFQDKIDNASDAQPLIGQLLDSVPRSFISHCYMITFDGWGTVADAAMSSSAWWALYFALFVGASGFGLTTLYTGIIVDELSKVSRDEGAAWELAAEHARAELWSAWRSRKRSEADLEVEVANGPQVQARVHAAVEELAGRCAMSFDALAARQPVVDVRGAFFDFARADAYESLDYTRFPLRVMAPQIAAEDLPWLLGTNSVLERLEICKGLDARRLFEVLSGERGALTFSEVFAGLLRLRGARPRTVALQHDLLSRARRQLEETARTEAALAERLEREFTRARNACDERVRAVRTPQALDEPAERPAQPWEARAISRLASLTHELSLLKGDAEDMCRAPDKAELCGPPTACSAAQTDHE